MTKPFVGISLNNGSHVWYARQVEAETKLLAAQGYGTMTTDAEDDPDTQINQIRSLVDDGARAVVVSATRQDAINPALDYCVERKVPVVAESVRLRHPAVVALVKADDLEVGRKLGRAVGATLDEATEINIVCFGFPALDEANRREWGFLGGVREYHPNVTVDYLDSRAQVPIARQVGLSWAESNSATRPPNVVLGVDDEALLGGLHGLADGGIDTDALTTAAFGISPPSGPERVDDGTISFGAAMFPELHGTILGELALSVIRGEDVLENTAPPAAVVTASNTPQSWTRFYSRSGDVYELDLEQARAES